ncbi:aromatic amino acid aminotransferase II [Scheffersomyces stipitis CBS 6054]|uniref:Aromatic amino acid aminotransferase II n=1 Tax=Scheffersomyces stipitis (strain ATCC 58785 / CBS 6054 / NBRC 10063 / NRRL Y-11545) TaxID=322104 RepID=A3GGR2_PICST|nr:aromatic amino acid aminotransferase II [Scheffersomyces stipitis CBS 6054]EAZ63574.2 aromatic amino acid aminotransferase II [Scheffersomyces stipitis CBS 6054]
MAPTSTTTAIPNNSIESLISSRASNRSFKHFAANTSDGAPKNFKPHPKPLALSFGRPNAQFFPVKKITVQVDEFPFQDSIFKNEEIDEVKEIVIERLPEEDEYSLGASEAFQYGDVKGLPAFQKFLRSFVERIHTPAYEDWAVHASNGAGEGLNKVVDALIDPGDIVLIEEFTFSPFGNNVRNVGGVIVPTKIKFEKNIKGDISADVDVDYLANLLENWDEVRPEHKGNKPKAFYTIPTSQNPTGFTQTPETRRRIYELASIHNFVIIEDDPYGYLTLPSFAEPSLENLKDHDLTVDDYINHSLLPSYLKYDTEGRVVRVETFSKVFAPGLRLGFLVGHKKIIDVITKYSSIVTRSPSGAAQLLLLNIIEQKYGGIDGWLAWILKMRLAYAHRRNVLISSIVNSEAYEKEYIKIISCDAGMFASLLVNFPEGTDNISKLTLLNYKLLQHGVAVVLGYKMAIDEKFSEASSNFLRLSYACLDSDVELREAGTRLAAAVKEFFENGLEY